MDTLVDHSAWHEKEARHDARIDLAAAHRIAVHDDFHEAIDNHFTLAVPGRPGRFYLNAWGLHWSEVTASNLIEVTEDGEVVAGEGFADRTAVCIHGPIHRLAPGAACVLHTHMPYATALTQLEDMHLEMTGQPALYFQDKIAYDYDYNGFAVDPSEGERMAAVMGDKPVLMLANHGVVVAGKSVAQAYHRLYFLERACRTQMFSMWTGQRRRIVSDAVIAKTREQAAIGNPNMTMTEAEYYFAALKRLLGRKEPDYAN